MSLKCPGCKNTIEYVDYWCQKSEWGQLVPVVMEQKDIEKKDSISTIDGYETFQEEFFCPDCGIEIDHIKIFTSRSKYKSRIKPKLKIKDLNKIAKLPQKKSPI